ncbi:MAG: proprotein convertase P-domain-containing protein, partial [Myxococcota bacterium]
PGDDPPGDDPPGDDPPGDDPPTTRFVSDADVTIPDNNSSGVTSSLAVTLDEEISQVTVEIEIVHTYIGDLVVALVAPDGQRAIIHNRQGGSTNDLSITTTLSMDPVIAAGTWRVEVSDRARLDNGYIDRWALQF